MSATEPRTRVQVEAEITFEWQSFQDADLAGDEADATRHYDKMNKLVEEYGLIPHPRPA